MNIRFQVFPVWIGKNARSNDKLFNLAHKEDIWLHAKSVSGSHVIIRAHQKNLINQYLKLQLLQLINLRQKDLDGFLSSTLKKVCQKS